MRKECITQIALDASILMDETYNTITHAFLFMFISLLTLFLVHISVTVLFH